MSKFRVTFERITPESAAHGDTADAGFMAEEPLTLRDALALWDGFGCHIEADCYPISEENPPRWLTAYKVKECFETGEIEHRSIHIDQQVTPASRVRIARLVGCYGVKNYET